MKLDCIILVKINKNLCIINFPVESHSQVSEREKNKTKKNILKRLFTVWNIQSRERTNIGSVSYRNRYWVYCIESYRLLLYRPILRASLQVHQLLTGHITHDNQRAFKRPVTRPPRACCFMVHDMGVSWS